MKRRFLGWFFFDLPRTILPLLVTLTLLTMGSGLAWIVAGLGNPWPVLLVWFIIGWVMVRRYYRNIYK